MTAATLHIGDVGAYGGHGIAGNHHAPGHFRCLWCGRWTTAAALKSGAWVDDCGERCDGVRGQRHPDADRPPQCDGQLTFEVSAVSP